MPWDPPDPELEIPSNEGGAPQDTGGISPQLGAGSRKTPYREPTKNNFSSSASQAKWASRRLLIRWDPPDPELESPASTYEYTQTLIWIPTKAHASQLSTIVDLPHRTTQTACKTSTQATTLNTSVPQKYTGGRRARSKGGTPTLKRTGSPLSTALPPSPQAQNP